MNAPLLELRNLSVAYQSPFGAVRAVDGVSLQIDAGEAVGVVGESGSGKSTLAHGILRLLPNTAEQQGEILLNGRELSALQEREMARIRGDQVAMVFQDPMTSFDPQRTIGYHLEEGLAAHRPELSRRQRHQIAVEQLSRTGLPEPEYQSKRYPHELSGGMRQRSMLALGLENSPALLVADEPTTALDVTIQAQILQLFSELLDDDELGAGLILISHDLAVVRQVCSRIIVMYAGRVVEDAPTEELFADPRHPYTQALIRATPRTTKDGARLSTIPGHPPTLTEVRNACSFRERCGHAVPRCFEDDPDLQVHGSRSVACFVGAESALSETPTEQQFDDSVHHEQLDREHDGSAIVELDDVAKHFHIHSASSRRLRRQTVYALRGLSLRVNRGETLGVVGESGSGKSTLARIILGLEAPTYGTVRVAGEDPTSRKSKARAEQRLQAVFQDPHGSLNPRMTIQEAVSEPLKNLGFDAQHRRERVQSILSEVQIGQDFASRYPGELSGGQAQRVAIARALAVEPQVMVLDEPTSGLDISIQAHILNLLADLQTHHHLTYILISHDLTVVRHLADRIAVMYMGRIVELADVNEIFAAPAHPYTAGLLAAIPDIEKPDKPRPIVSGEPPSPLNPPAGCSFHSRCPIARDVCSELDPALEPFGESLVACHFAGEISRILQIAPRKVVDS